MKILKMNAVKSEKPLSILLDNNQPLALIINKVAQLKKIEMTVRQSLHEILCSTKIENNFTNELLNAIHIGQYANGRLQLICENAAVSTRLRYLLPELIQHLRRSNYLPALINIELKITRQNSISQPANVKPSISAINSKRIKEMLKNLKANEETD